MHLNALNAVALFALGLKGVAMSPMETLLRREERQRARQAKRAARHASWPACGERAQARYGRQVAQGRLKRENGLVTAGSAACHMIWEEIPA